MPDLDAGEGTQLRVLQEADAPAIFALLDANRAYLRQWLPWLDDNMRVEDSQEFIRGTREQLEDDAGFQCGIWHHDELVGVIGFFSLNREAHAIALGYWLAEAKQGQGLVTRATRAMVDYALVRWGLDRVVIYAATENWPSRAVIERVGFTFHRIKPDAEWLYDHFVDHAVYSMTAEQWEALRRNTRTKGP